MIHQGIATAEQNVGDTLLFGDFPDPLLIVEVGRVLGQPQDLDVLADVGMGEKGCGLPRSVNRPVVQGEDDALSGSPRSDQQPSDKEEKLSAVLASLGHTRNERAVLTRGVVDGSEGRDLAVLPRRRDLHLFSSPHPGPRQVRVKMEVGFILEPEFVSGSCAKSPFFRA